MKSPSHCSAQAIVEFALTIPIILFVVLLFFDLGRVVYQYSALQNAVREAARYATVNRFTTASQREAVVDQIVMDYAIGVDLSVDDISLYCDRDQSDLSLPCDEYITVAANTDIQPITILGARLIGVGNTIPVIAESTMQMTPFGKSKQDG